MLLNGPCDGDEPLSSQTNGYIASGMPLMAGFGPARRILSISPSFTRVGASEPNFGGEELGPAHRSEECRWWGEWNRWEDFPGLQVTDSATRPAVRRPDAHSRPYCAILLRNVLRSIPRISAACVLFAAGARQDIANVIGFHLRQRPVSRRWCAGPRTGRKSAGRNLDCLLIVHDDDSLDHVLQFACIARPGVILHRLHGLFEKRGTVLPSSEANFSAKRTNRGMSPLRAAKAGLRS